MNREENLKLAELMASRLCHDLVGPIGAVCNGMELANEDPEMAQEAMQLAQESAEKLAAVAQLFRIAYGAAGTAAEPQDIHLRLSDYLLRARIALDWDIHATPLEGDEKKLMLNAALLAVECLPRGGRLAISRRQDSLGGTLVLRADGEPVRMPEQSLLAMEGKKEPTAQTVQGVVLQEFASRCRAKVGIEAVGDNRVEITISLP